MPSSNNSKLLSASYEPAIVRHDFQNCIFKAEHVCFWGHLKLSLAVRGAGTRQWSELLKKKKVLPLYKRRCKGLMRLIRTWGKNPTYWRLGPNLHVKTLNKLALKGEAQNRRLMLSSYGCSHTVKPVWADGRRSCRGMKAGGWCDTCAFTLQVKHKQTIKPASSYRKTPLCNNLLFFYWALVSVSPSLFISLCPPRVSTSKRM